MNTISVDGAFIFPSLKDLTKSHEPKFSTPIFDRFMKPVTAATLKRIYKKASAESSFEFHQNDMVTDIPEAMYGGFLFGHFGHFLLESLSRLWFAEKKEIPIVFHSHQRSFLSWQLEIFDHLGISADRIHIINTKIRCSHLIVPEEGFIISSFFGENHSKFLQKTAYVPNKSQNIWLSRSRLPESFGKIEGEIELENTLLSEGWRVIHPELLSPKEQINLLATSSRIAGIEGSAFHNLIFIKECLAKIRIIGRRATPGSIDNNYTIIAETNNLDQHAYRGSLIHTSGAGNRASYKIKDPYDILSFITEDP